MVSEKLNPRPRIDWMVFLKKFLNYLKCFRSWRTGMGLVSDPGMTTELNKCRDGSCWLLLLLHSLSAPAPSRNALPLFFRPVWNLMARFFFFELKMAQSLSDSHAIL
jgi:hypothetical protein